MLVSLIVGALVALVAYLVIREAGGDQLRPVATPDVPVAPFRVDGEGDYDFDVVGEGYYQEALEQICGGRCEDGHELETEAVLVCEDSNPHDDQAVAVAIDGRKVAHLSREDARRFRETLASKGLVGRPVIVPALIVGGWRRERSGRVDEGSFGVKLDL